LIYSEKKWKLSRIWTRLFKNESYEIDVKEMFVKYTRIFNHEITKEKRIIQSEKSIIHNTLLEIKENYLYEIVNILNHCDIENTKKNLVNV